MIKAHSLCIGFFIIQGRGSGFDVKEWFADAHRGCLRGMCPPPVEKPDFCLFVLFCFVFKRKSCHLVNTFGCKYKNRRWEKIYVRSNCILGEYNFLKFCPNLNSFLPKFTGNFLKLSQKTFKINHQKKIANFIINYINAQHSLNHRFRKILSECMFAWVQRAGSLAGVARGQCPLA